MLRTLPRFRSRSLLNRTTSVVAWLLFATVACWAPALSAATAVRITSNVASSTVPAIARGADGKSRVVWTDTRTGNSEIFFTMLDDWGNRLLPDIQVSHTPAVSSTVPRVGVDGQGYAYVCWLENKTVWLAKLDDSGNNVDSTAVSLGFNYLAEFPDISVAASSGLGVGFTSQSGVSDEDYMVLYDSDLNKICQRLMFTNLTWLDRHVTIECDDELYCTLYWQSVSLTTQNLTGGAMTPVCGNFGSGNICSGNNYSTMSNHAAGLVVQRGNRIHVGNGAGCPAAFSELPGPSITPSAWQLDATRSVVAWDDRRSGNSDIYFAHYSNSTFAKVGVDSLLAGGSSSSTAPSVASDLAGTALVAWQDNRDGNNEIYFARTPEPSGSFGAFTGTVYDAVTLQPIPYALVEIQGPERNPLLPARRIVAGADGHYRAAGLPAGLHSLVASSAGHVSPRMDGVSLAAGQTRVVDLRVSTGFVLTGVVRDIDSERPIRGAQISLESLSGPPFLRTTETAVDGRYHFDLPAGAFTITVRDTVPGDSSDYFSVANDYYRSESVSPLTVTADTPLDFALASNTVVLLHGIRETGEYWGKAANVTSGDSLLRARLEHAGFHTEAPTRKWFPGIPEQGTSVARWFADQEFTSARVIAHSMGGLAARWAIEELAGAGIDGSVPLLVTLGTPHHGSPVATDAHGLLLALGALPEAFGIVPFTGGLSLLAWELQIRERWPFLIDLEPGSANLNRLNYGASDYSDDPLRFTCSLDGGPAHDVEQIAGTTSYIALAGESPASDRWFLQPSLGAACANDGVVPVHSARLWNPAVSNLRTRCLENGGTGADCGVGHAPAGKGATATLGAGDPLFVSSGCVAVQLVNILHGDVPSEDCPNPSSTLSVADSSFDLLSEVDQILGPSDSLSSTFTVVPGQSFIVRVVWQRGGVRLRLAGPGGVVVDSAACAGDPARLFASEPALHWQFLEIVAPAAGTWSVIASTDADSAQHVSLRRMVTGDVMLEASARAGSGAPGQPVHVEGTLLRSGTPLLAASVVGHWSGSSGLSGDIVLHDDGQGDDFVSGDGVYSGAVVPPSPGTYSLEVRASGGGGPAYGERAALSTFRSANAPDIRIADDDVTATPNWAFPGDQLPLQVHVHNVGTASADSVWFVVHDDSTGTTVTDSLIAVPAGGDVTVPVAFRSARRGLHRLSLWAVPTGNSPDAHPGDNGTSLVVQIVEFGSQPVVGVPRDPANASTSPRLATRVSPHPAHDLARIEFLLPEPAAGSRLTIFDVAGRVLHRAESGPLRQGWQSLTWDLNRTTTARRAGVYFYRIEAAGEVGNGTIVVR